MATAEEVITNALINGLPNYPAAGAGTTWDRQYMAGETAQHYARGILAELAKAGFAVTKTSTDT